MKKFLCRFDTSFDMKMMVEKNCHSNHFQIPWAPSELPANWCSQASLSGWIGWDSISWYFRRGSWDLKITQYIVRVLPSFSSQYWCRISVILFVVLPTTRSLNYSALACLTKGLPLKYLNSASFVNFQKLDDSETFVCSS